MATKYSCTDLRHHVCEAGGEDDAAPVAGEVGDAGPRAEAGREAPETGGQEAGQQGAAAQHRQTTDLNSEESTLAEQCAPPSLVGLLHYCALIGRELP